jgi:hypothetical protein
MNSNEKKTKRRIKIMKNRNIMKQKMKNKEK